MPALIAPPVPTTETAVPCPLPQRFWEGDRVVHWEENGTLDVRRSLSVWRPAADSPRVVGTTLTDEMVRRALSFQVLGDQRMRYVPRFVPGTDLLPGQPLKARALEAVALDAESVIPFVASFGEHRGFWSLRDLTAKQAGADAALCVPAVLPVDQMREALAVMLDEYPAAVSFHRPSGRFYARYETWGQRGDGTRPRIQLRTFVYVLAAPEGR